MSSNARAIFPDCTPDLADLMTPELRAIVPELDVHIGAPDGEAALIEMIRPYQAVMPLFVYLSETVLTACPELRTITYLSTGIATRLDLAAAERLGIRVRGVRGYGDRSVAEHALALMFASARNIASMDRDLRAGVWLQRPGTELAGKILGIVGLGGVGRSLAPLAAAIGMKVIAWNRSGVPADCPCTFAELDELLACADIVSLHLALNDETRGMIDLRRISLMKQRAILINTARGGLVDETALIDALSIGRLGHAGIDTYHVEPLPADHPLTRLPNVTLTTHAAWITVEASRNLLRIGLETLREELQALD